MRRPCFRFTTRRLMLGVAVLALLLGGFVRFAQRPRPRVMIYCFGDCLIDWSDGSRTQVKAERGSIEINHVSPCLTMVRWPSGAWSVYLDLKGTGVGQISVIGSNGLPRREKFNFPARTAEHLRYDIHRRRGNRQ